MLDKLALLHRPASREADAASMCSSLAGRRSSGFLEDYSPEEHDALWCLCKTHKRTKTTKQGSPVSWLPVRLRSLRSVRAPSASGMDPARKRNGAKMKNDG